MSSHTIRQFSWTEEYHAGMDPERLLTREWLVTNGLGGYASGTISGVATRRYHGLLISALPAPHGRMLLLANLTEQLRFPDGELWVIGGEERDTQLRMEAVETLDEFILEAGLPIWRFHRRGVVLEKRLFLPHEQNTVYVQYRLLSGQEPLRLKVKPLINCRSHDAQVNTPLPKSWEVRSWENKHEIHMQEDLPSLKLRLLGDDTAFTIQPQWLTELMYRIERRRGYAASGDVAAPGYFRTTLSVDQPATLIASTEEWATIDSMSPENVLEKEYRRRNKLVQLAHPSLRSGVGAELVLAADQFLIRPASRLEDTAVAKASGDDARTVIAGYHWFTDWGRDTMISLEGLTLSTGRHAEAGWILRTFAQHIRDGLIPNLFPEGGTEGLYHTADATLWFFHALHRYTEVTGDQDTLHTLLPALQEIIRKHIAGTRFGIGLDPADGLLKQGAEGYQLTWMDAKVGDWVVTPRRGKAVEINALWYNALKLLEGWLREAQDVKGANDLQALSEQTRASFEKRFWSDSLGYLYDVVDGEHGDDDACRPNQVFAISLPHPVLNRDHWEPVMQTVEQRLVTPLGLRTLSPGHPDYKSTYDGDLRSRDAAYHQGTVWGWLIGPYLDAWLKVHTTPEERKEARELLTGLSVHLGEACLGTVSEIFDGDAPYWPRGCVAQAWSVAELLRCWIKTEQTT